MFVNSLITGFKPANWYVSPSDPSLISAVICRLVVHYFPAKFDNSGWVTALFSCYIWQFWLNYRIIFLQYLTILAITTLSSCDIWQFWLLPRCFPAIFDNYGDHHLVFLQCFTVLAITALFSCILDKCGWVTAVFSCDIQQFWLLPHVFISLLNNIKSSTSGACASQWA